MKKRSTTAKFIEKARKVHGEEYDYSETEYVETRSKVQIRHKKCGKSFWQTPNSHLRKQGCPHCYSRNVRVTAKEFIRRAEKIHGEEYDYSQTEYVGCEDEVKIFHNKCGRYFWQRADVHLMGCGCTHCCSNARLTTELFIERAKKVHNDEYSYDKTDYINSKTKIQIKHNKCGKYFEQNVSSHLNGRGCPYCGGSKKLTTKEFIERVKKIHNDEYDYSQIEYIGFDNKIKIKHNKCGRYFWQTPRSHSNRRGCPFCNQSKLEIETEQYLIKNGIKYEIQKKYDGCRNKNPLPFDFYLPELNILIECQGEQHFKPIKAINHKTFTKEQAFENFKYQYKRDNIKRAYAKKRKIKLIEINYKDIKRISEIFDGEFNSKQKIRQLQFDL